MPEQVEAFKTVVGVATLLLVQFPTSLQDDVNLLGGGEAQATPLPCDLENAVRFRIEKKKILNEYLQQMAQALKVGEERGRIFPAVFCKMQPSNFSLSRPLRGGNTTRSRHASRS